MAPFEIHRKGLKFIQPQDQPSLSAPRTYVAYLGRQDKWSLVYDQGRFEYTPNCHSYNPKIITKLTVLKDGAKPKYT